MRPPCRIVKLRRFGSVALDWKNRASINVSHCCALRFSSPGKTTEGERRQFRSMATPSLVSTWERCMSLAGVEATIEVHILPARETL